MPDCWETLRQSRNILHCRKQRTCMTSRRANIEYGEKRNKKHNPDHSEVYKRAYKHTSRACISSSYRKQAEEKIASTRPVPSKSLSRKPSSSRASQCTHGSMRSYSVGRILNLTRPRKRFSIVLSGMQSQLFGCRRIKRHPCQSNQFQEYMVRVVLCETCLKANDLVTFKAQRIRRKGLSANHSFRIVLTIDNERFKASSINGRRSDHLNAWMLSSRSDLLPCA